jgi:hypothetical protein
VLSIADRRAGRGEKVMPLPPQAMSEKQLSALLAKLNEDAVFREKLQGVADLGVERRGVGGGSWLCQLD